MSENQNAGRAFVFLCIFGLRRDGDEEKYMVCDPAVRIGGIADRSVRSGRGTEGFGSDIDEYIR